MANPNPSPATRFKPGQSGNPSGRSAEEQKMHNEAAKIAAELKLKAVSCLQEKVGGSEISEDQVLELLFNADALRMFKEVEDRAHGTPTQMHGEDPEKPMSFGAIGLVPLEADDDET